MNSEQYEIFNLASENEYWRELGMAIVGRGSDEEKWPPGMSLVQACEIELTKLGIIKLETND